MVPTSLKLGVGLAAVLSVAGWCGPQSSDLTLGDGLSSTQPQVGFIYTCRPLNDQGQGAQVNGPWIDQAQVTWDATLKPTVDGSVSWPSIFSATEKDDMLILNSNGLPTHPTGVFPITQTDDAYQHDHNPNQITQHEMSLTLPRTPTLAANPACVTGEVGMMLTGIPLFSGFDAQGRDAVAHEIQDACGGHPQEQGQYHYHGPSDCLSDSTDLSVHSDVLGYALDGFGIFGTRGEVGQELRTTDLDECHGHTHEIDWHENRQTLYHYHLTADFPYSVGCFKGTPFRIRL